MAYEAVKDTFHAGLSAAQQKTNQSVAENLAKPSAAAQAKQQTTQSVVGNLAKPSAAAQAKQQAAYAAAEQSPAVVPQAPAAGTGNINPPQTTAGSGTPAQSKPTSGSNVGQSLTQDEYWRLMLEEEARQKQAAAQQAAAQQAAAQQSAYAAAEQSPAVVPQAPAAGTGSINPPRTTTDSGLNSQVNGGATPAAGSQAQAAAKADALAAANPSNDVTPTASSGLNGQVNGSTPPAGGVTPSAGGSVNEQTNTALAQALEKLERQQSELAGLISAMQAQQSGGPSSDGKENTGTKPSTGSGLNGQVNAGYEPGATEKPGTKPSIGSGLNGQANAGYEPTTGSPAGTSPGTSPGTGTGTPGFSLTPEQIRQLQLYMGVEPTGVWDANTQARAGKNSMEEWWNGYQAGLAWDFGPGGNPGEEARKWAALYAPNDYARWLVQRGEAADLSQAFQIIRGLALGTPEASSTPTPGSADTGAYAPSTAVAGQVGPLQAQAPDFQSLLDQWATAARQQAEGQIDYATQQGITELERAEEDARPQFQMQRDQAAVAEAKALDNQALYAERRGDRGGIGAAQYAGIQNTAAQNQLAINQAQTKLSTDTARQIADLRAQGEYQKADQLLQIAQQYLSQLITLQQWNAEFGLNVDTFNKELEKWNLEFEADVAALTGTYQGQPTLNALGMMAEAGLAAAQSGIMPSESQLQALERLYGYDRSAITGMVQTALLGLGGGSSGGSSVVGGYTGNPTRLTPSAESDVYGNGGLTSEEIAQLQRVLGVTADGQWGPISAAAAQNRWGASGPMDAVSAWNAFAGQANSYQAMLAGLTGGQQTSAGLTPGGTPNAGASSSSPVDMADTTGRQLFDSAGRLMVSENQLSVHARNALIAARNAMQGDREHGREVASNLLEARARSGYLNNAEYAAVLTLLGLLS